MSGTKILWGQILIVFTIVLTTTWAATEWTAWRLGFQPQLGAPWFEISGWPIYYPPAFFWWWYFYDAYAPPIFIEGAIIGAPALPRAADQIAAVEEAARVAEGQGVTVHFHAVGLTWCSPEMLEAVAERSAVTGRRVFMHLLETRRQRIWCDRVFAGDPIGALDRFGMLSGRLGCAHGVHLREDEIERLAERGVTVSVNTSSNLRLGSGIAPIPLFLKHGLAFGLGLDSFGFDDTPDWFTEMRLTRLVHGGDGMRRVLGDAELFAAAMTGRTLAGGEGEDWVALDLDLLAADRIAGHADPWQLFLVRAAGRHVTDLVVDGRVVVRDRTVLGVDLPAAQRELLAAARASPSADVEAIAVHAAALERYFSDPHQSG